MEKSLNTQLEAAVEILAAKIANMSNQGYTMKDEQMKQLVHEREMMYEGDRKIIKKIICEYGCE